MFFFLFADNLLCSALHESLEPRVFLFGCGPHPSWFQLVILEECEVCQEPGWCFISSKHQSAKSTFLLLSPLYIMCTIRASVCLVSTFEHTTILVLGTFQTCLRFLRVFTKDLKSVTILLTWGGHLTFLEWSLTHFGRARCCSFLARWKVSANLWQVIQEGPLNRGITRIWCCPQLTWVSTLFWEGLCCQYWYQCWYQAQFYLPDQYSYTLSTCEKNTDPMWRF